MGMGDFPIIPFFLGIVFAYVALFVPLVGIPLSLRRKATGRPTGRARVLASIFLAAALLALAVGVVKPWFTLSVAVLNALWLLVSLGEPRASVERRPTRRR